MAKFAKKKSNFGIIDNIPVPADEHTHTHNDTHTDVYEPEVTVKQTKTKRIQILTYSSLVRRMDVYAKRHGLSRAEVFEKAVTEFLDNQ